MGEKQGSKTKKYLLKDQGQQELPGMPERTPLVIAAESYLSMKGELEAVKEQFDNCKVELIQEFIKSGKNRLNIDGNWISYTHKETDTISIEKPKG